MKTELSLLVRAGSAARPCYLYWFIYKDDDVDTRRRVSVSASNEDVLDMLKNPPSWE